MRALLVLSLMVGAASAQITTVGIVVATLPWLFGPYQRQAFLLSQQLHSLGYEVYWLPTAWHMAAPERKYTTAEDLLAQIRETNTVRPQDYPDRHITYLGQQELRKHHDMVSIAQLNRLADIHAVDAYITILDVNTVLRDADFTVPAITWLPYHYTLPTWIDLYTLNAFSAIASLSPSSARMLEREVTKVPTVHIPHIIDEAGLEWERTFAVRALRGVPQDAFMVLMQGGNYEAHDRKGWTAALQSFKLLHETHPDSFLYLHAISSITVAENERGRSAPAILTNQGVNLQLLAKTLGLPKDAYKIDENMYTAAQAKALKVIADVCLHASKSEGFGLNVLECQALGTPVITTKFFAMGDFTRLGISVPHRQVEFMINGMVATPDVRGVANALREVYDVVTTAKDGEEAIAPRWEDPATTHQFIMEHFAAERVGELFQSLLEQPKITSVPPSEREKPDYGSTGKAPAMFTIIRDQNPRYVDWDTPWTLLADPSVHVKTDHLNRLIQGAMAQEPKPVNVVPTKDEFGHTMMPNIAGNLNPRLTLLVRTAYFANAQAKTTSRYSISSMLITQEIENVGSLPDGLAAVAVQPRTEL